MGHARVTAIDEKVEDDDPQVAIESLGDGIEGQLLSLLRAWSTSKNACDTQDAACVAKFKIKSDAEADVINKRTAVQTAMAAKDSAKTNVQTACAEMRANAGHGAPTETTTPAPTAAPKL